MAGIVKITRFWYSVLKVSLLKARNRAILPQTSSKAAHLLEVTNTGPASQQEENQMSLAPGDSIITTAWLLFQKVPICPLEVLALDWVDKIQPWH